MAVNVLISTAAILHEDTRTFPLSHKTSIDVEIRYGRLTNLNFVIPFLSKLNEFKENH